MRSRPLRSLELESSSTREFYAAAAAGGVGPVISVLMRMSGRGSFVIDHELSNVGDTKDRTKHLVEIIEKGL